MGAAIPLNQSLAVPKDTLVEWALRQDPRVCLAALVAWKTASRWGDVCNLARRHFVLVTDKEVIVDWHNLPKGRSRNPYSKSKLVVIAGPLTAAIAALIRSLGDFQQLSGITASQLDRMWAADPSMSQFSAHSIKRGAVDHLMEAKAGGAPFPAHLISRLAKHANDVDPTVADMTVRYVSNSVALARVLQTAEVTAFL
ncbi:hypothetical protein DIPPA_14232 [Diplonema papillatum]|nr:hypothetical protein DIPPA_14232 [Diplonema papillatum]